MQLSKKADYAIRAMTILATQPLEKNLLAQELADTGQIPIKFLEQILLELKRANLLESRRGVRGGYRLARPSRLITVAEIIESVDGGLLRMFQEKDYPDFPGMRGIQRCLSEAESAANRILRETSLEDLVRVASDAAMVRFEI